MWLAVPKVRAMPMPLLAMTLPREGSVLPMTLAPELTRKPYVFGAGVPFGLTPIQFASKVWLPPMMLMPAAPGPAKP